MGTELLHPYDCLRDRITVSPHRRNIYNHQTVHGSKPTRNKHSPLRSDPKRKSFDHTAAISRRSSSEDLKPVRNHNSNKLVMGQVTILRRGEKVDQKAAKVNPPNDLVVPGTERLGPEPAMVGRHVRIREPSPSTKVVGSKIVEINPAMYAGSAFAVSPAPESLPLPSFSKKKREEVGVVAVDASATRDLRRLLRLE